MRFVIAERLTKKIRYAIIDTVKDRDFIYFSRYFSVDLTIGVYKYRKGGFYHYEDINRR